MCVCCRGLDWNLERNTCYPVILLDVMEYVFAGVFWCVCVCLSMCVFSLVCVYVCVFMC